MNFVERSFRHAFVILREPAFSKESEERLGNLRAITDNDIIERLETCLGTQKSLSGSINGALRRYLTDHGWAAGSPIFRDTRHAGDKWRLDFAKKSISAEVAFNHGEATARNLLKPCWPVDLTMFKRLFRHRPGS